MKTEHQPNASGSEQRILRNTSYLTGAFIIQKILSFAYFIFIAKALGAFDLGLYDPAKSFIPILLILIDFSLSAVLTREVARHPEKALTYLSSVLSVKGILAVILLVLFGLFTNFSQFGEIERSVIYVIALIVAFDSFTATFFSLFRGLQNMKFEAVGMIINQLVTTGIGLLILRAGYGIRGLFIATLIGSVINFIYSFYLIRLKFGVFPTFKWKGSLIKSFVRMALPFALAAILVKLFTYTDRFLLLLDAGRHAVGLYATAHKLTFALEFIPSAFAAAFYPAMSAYFIYDKTMLGKTFERALFYLTIIALPISLASLALADQIFHTLWGNLYILSVPSFQIMISAIIFIFLNFPVGSLLNATNNQRFNTINMAIVVLVNIVLNLLLIDKYQHIGSAIATTVSLILLFFLGLFRVNSIVKYDVSKLLKTFFSTFCVAAIAALCAWYAKQFVPIYITMPLFLIVYGSGLFVFKIISKNDIHIAAQAIFKKGKV